MAFYDDKRFILSHIRHSFITCDDTGMCETVMLNESPNRYPYESIYHHPFDYNSDSDDNLDSLSICSDDYQEFKFKEEDINLFKETELELKSELAEDQPLQSLDIMSDSYGIMGIRRRSNTAQRLEKMKKERKYQSKTKVISWKSPNKVVSCLEKGDVTYIRRVVLNPSALSEEELAMLEYNEKENLYYETDEFRNHLFPIINIDKKAFKKNEDNNAKEITDKEEQNEVSEPEKKPSERVRRKSALTLQIERCPTAPINPFNEFTRFDGRVSDGNAHTKRIRIFFKVHQNNPDFNPGDFSTKLPMALSGINCGPNWIEIVVLANARVSDLIGLICWHYTHLQIGPPLKADLTMYALKIAEENGDVDNDFPSLNFNDDIKRYGFPYLALVEVETQVIVTVYIESEEVFSQIIVNSPNTTLQEVVDQIKKRRSQLFRNRSNSGPDSDYLRLELRSDPGVGLDLKSRISKYIDSNSNGSHVTFSLIFINKQQDLLNIVDSTLENTSTLTTKASSLNKNKSDINISSLRMNYSTSALYSLDDSSQQSTKRRVRDPNDWSTTMLDMMEAPLYQCFEVFAVNKFYNTPIEMGISGTKVEITPKPINSRSPSTNFTERIFSRFNQIKAVNINVEDVVECHAIPSTKQMIERKAFRIIYYNGNDFKRLKFDGDPSTIDDIVFKLQHVMKMSPSVRRTEYQSIKNRKKNISTKVYFKSKISSGSSSSGSEDNLTDHSIYTTNSQDDSKKIDIFRKKDSKFRKFRSKYSD